MQKKKAGNDSKNILKKRQRRSLGPQNVTDKKDARQTLAEIIVTKGAAARSPDQLRKRYPGGRPGGSGPTMP